MEHIPNEKLHLGDFLSTLDPELVETLDHALNYEGYGIDTLLRAESFLERDKQAELINSLEKFAQSITESEKRDALDSIIDILS